MASPVTYIVRNLHVTLRARTDRASYRPGERGQIVVQPLVNDGFQFKIKEVGVQAIRRKAVRGRSLLAGLPREGRRTRAGLQVEFPFEIRKPPADFKGPLPKGEVVVLQLTYRLDERSRTIQVNLTVHRRS